jgi:hypothetical protein
MSGLSKQLSVGPENEVACQKGLLCGSLQPQYRFLHHYRRPSRHVRSSPLMGIHQGLSPSFFPQVLLAANNLPQAL